MEIERKSKYLHDRVKMTGFGETHEAAIRENIGKGLDSFTITIFRDFGDLTIPDTTESILTFNKGKEDLYHFNEYKMRITNRPDDIAASTWETVKVNSQYPKNTITLKELYNLKLKGSVEKTICWEKKLADGTKEVKSFIGFKKGVHEKLNAYNSYPLENYPWPTMEKELRDSEAIKLLADPKKADNLVKSMKKGNVQQVVLKSGDTELLRWIAVDAEFKKIGIYENNPRVYISNEMKEALKLEFESKRLAALPLEGQADLSPTEPVAHLTPAEAGIPSQENPGQAPGAKVVDMYPDGDSKEVTISTGMAQQGEANKVTPGESVQAADGVKENIFTRKLADNELNDKGQNSALPLVGKDTGLVVAETGNGKIVPLTPVAKGAKPAKNTAKKPLTVKTAKVTPAPKKRKTHKM